VTKLSVRDTDPRFERVRGALGYAFTVLVGVQGEEASAVHRGNQPQTMAEIANEHEFGLGVPERSWLRAWVDENQPMIQNDLRRAAMRILEGRLTIQQAADLLGTKYVASIQMRIANGIAPANAPATIERKGSSTPLIDTGQFRSSITYIMEQLLTGQASARIGGGVTP
jgi:hypothetical protein